jgi:hypothetical protein
MITSGTILIQQNTHHPRFFQLHDSSPHSWMSVTHNLTPHNLAAELQADGWTFFFLAGAVRSTAFGFDRMKMIDAALKRVIATVKRQGHNCLEINEVATHSFLGMPYVSVSAHPRHIQKGTRLSVRKPSW